MKDVLNLRLPVSAHEMQNTSLFSVGQHTFDHSALILVSKADILNGQLKGIEHFQSISTYTALHSSQPSMHKTSFDKSVPSGFKA